MLISAWISVKNMRMCDVLLNFFVSVYTANFAAHKKYIKTHIFRTKKICVFRENRTRIKNLRTHMYILCIKFMHFSCVWINVRFLCIPYMRFYTQFIHIVWTVRACKIYTVNIHITYIKYIFYMRLIIYAQYMYTRYAFFMRFLYVTYALYTHVKYMYDNIYILCI